MLFVLLMIDHIGYAIDDQVHGSDDASKICALGTDAKFEKAKHLSWSGQHAASEKEYLALTEECPWNSDYLIGLGDVRLWQGKLDLAIDAYRKALLISPKRIDAMQSLARALRQKEDAPGIKDLLSESAKNLPSEHHEKMVSYVASLDYSYETESFAKKSQWEAEVGGGYEYLNHGYRDWSSSFVGVKHADPEQVFYGRVAEINRFGLTDAALTAGLTQRFQDRWTASLETYDSPTGHFIPQWSMQGGLRYQTDWPVGIEVGFRHSSYRTLSNEIGTITLDSYIEQFRVASTLYMSQLQGDGSLKFSGALDASWYYGEKSNVGMILGFGTQPIVVAPGVYRNDQVQTYLLKGVHEIGGSWALFFDAGVIVQGNSYTRSGANMGIKYSF